MVYIEESLKKSVFWIKKSPSDFLLPFLEENHD